MTNLKASANRIQTLVRDALAVAKTASRNSKSLSGSNFYGDKFHRLSVEIIKESNVLIRSIGQHVGADEIASLQQTVHALASATTSVRDRNRRKKEFDLCLQTVIMPAIQSMDTDSIPKTEQVLPIAVVRNTRTYLENIVIQANGAYERGWYEASSVMIRKFVENLIIEVFEAKNTASEIKDGDDNFLMLEKLINVLISKKEWNLQRDTKRFLPEIKALGDRAAHNRRYLCTKQDIDRVLSGLRVIADDLLHLAGFR